MEDGDEAGVERALRRFADAGATEFQVAAVGSAADRDRTTEFLGHLSAARAGT